MRPSSSHCQFGEFYKYQISTVQFWKLTHKKMKFSWHFADFKKGNSNVTLASVYSQKKSMFCVWAYLRISLAWINQLTFTFIHTCATVYGLLWSKLMRNRLASIPMHFDCNVIASFFCLGTQMKQWTSGPHSQSNQFLQFFENNSWAK